MFGTLWKATQSDWQCWMCNQRVSCPLVRGRQLRGPPGAGDDHEGDGPLPGPGAPSPVEAAPGPTSLQSPAACLGSATSLSRGKREFVVDCLSKADVPQAAPMPNPTKLRAGAGCAPQSGERWRQQIIDGPGLPSFNDQLSARSAASFGGGGSLRPFPRFNPGLCSPDGCFEPIDSKYFATVEATRARLAEVQATQQRRAERSAQRLDDDTVRRSVSRPDASRVTERSASAEYAMATRSQSQPSGVGVATKTNLGTLHTQEKDSGTVVRPRPTNGPVVAAEDTEELEEAADEDIACSDVGARVDEEYERRMSSERIRQVKAVAKDGNLLRGHSQEKETYFSRPLRRNPLAEPVPDPSLAVREQEERNDVESYREVMAAKFSSIGVSSTEEEHWVSHLGHGAKSHAVVEGISKYHSHCIALGQPFAMPGDTLNCGDISSQRDDLDRITQADADGSITRLWPRRESSHHA